MLGGLSVAANASDYTLTYQLGGTTKTALQFGSTELPVDTYQRCVCVHACVCVCVYMHTCMCMHISVYSILVGVFVCIVYVG